MIELMSNTVNSLKERETLLYVTAADTTARTEQVGARPPMQSIGDRTIFDPATMVIGKLYTFEVMGEPLIARKKPSGGIQIYYLPK